MQRNAAAFASMVVVLAGCGGSSQTPASTVTSTVQITRTVTATATPPATAPKTIMETDVPAFNKKLWEAGIGAVY